MIAELIKGLDRNETFRRPLKVVRNLFSECPPRNQELVFHSYSFDYPELVFEFAARGETYTSKVFVNSLERDEIAAVDPELWERVIMAVGMALAPFHFPLADFSSIRVDCGALSANAKKFYEDYYLAGIAEFRYRQGLNPNKRIRVYGRPDIECPQPIKGIFDEKILILNGGGKDTAVMAELLRETGFPLAWSSIGLTPHQARIVEASGFSESYVIEFETDARIAEDACYPWGHLPYSALYMCLGLIPAVVKGFKYVATGNEYSANFGNMEFRGTEINHQYSKSHAYESGFNQFLEQNVVQGVTFFSALRPFYDIRIAAMLSQSMHYASAFNSCNSITSWCNNCPKCAFTFLALAPFTGTEQLISIFGENLFEIKSIRLFILDLLNAHIKPWECVGTQEECQLVMALTLCKYSDMEFSEFPFRKDLEEACNHIDICTLKSKYLVEIQAPHNIPESLFDSIIDKARDLSPTLNRV